MTNPMLSTIWARELSRAAQYTAPGYPPIRGLQALREETCDYLARRRGVHARPEEVLIVGGTQQAIALIAGVLADPGDGVAWEEPNYPVRRQVPPSPPPHMHATPTSCR